jgi:hypothetical protein
MSIELRDISGLATASSQFKTGKKLALKLMEEDVSYSLTFDISSTINNYISTPVNRPLILYSLNSYNDSAITSWLTLFDNHEGTFDPSEENPVIRIPVPSKKVRDIYFPRGIRFDYGLSVIGSVAPSNYDISLANNSLFMSGIYSPFTPPL